MRSTNTTGIVQVPMSIPTNTAGNAAAFNSGSVGATVPRVTLCADTPAPVGLAQGSTTAAQTGSLIMGAVTTTPPSYTTAQTSPVSLDLFGYTRVSVNKWQPGTSGFAAAAFSLMTTELNSLANGNTVVSSVAGPFSQTNTVSSRLAEIWITLGGNFGATPAVGGNITGWFLRSTDGGTTFEDTNANTALPRAPDFIIPLVAAAYSASDVVFAAPFVRLPSCAFKVWILNNAGASAALAASGNILTMAPIS